MDGVHVIKHATTYPTCIETFRGNNGYILTLFNIYIYTYTHIYIYTPVKIETGGGGYIILIIFIENLRQMRNSSLHFGHHVIIHIIPYCTHCTVFIYRIYTRTDMYIISFSSIQMMRTYCWNSQNNSFFNLRLLY